MVTTLALSPFVHESRHLVHGREVAGRDGRVGLANTLHSCGVTEELEGCFEGVQVLRREPADAIDTLVDESFP